MNLAENNRKYISELRIHSLIEFYFFTPEFLVTLMVFYTNDVSFHFIGSVDQHNACYWSENNPNWIRPFSN